MSEYVNNLLVVEDHTTPYGYFIARTSEKITKKMKLLVDGEPYDINGDCRPEMFPLKNGSGTYLIKLMKNYRGKVYSNAGKIKLKVVLNKENAWMYSPNQYVNYNEETPAYLMAKEIGEGKVKRLIFEEICNYINRNFRYDFVRAALVNKVGVLPKIDECWNSRQGICQDLAALAVCMLRANDIPSWIVIGLADANKHAWVECLIGSEKYKYDPTADISGWKPKKYREDRRF